MAIDKRVNYSMQGHKKPARNYLGKQKTVKNIPIKWKSGPKAPETELAYITKAEKDLILKKDLHGSLKHGPNTGPDGIMSLDTQGDYTPDRSPGGGGGGGDHEAQNIATQQAARQKAVLTGKIQRDPNTGNWEAGRNLGRRENLMGLGLGQGNINIGRSIRGDLRGRRSRLGGIFGALGRGALSIFGGIPGRVASGFMTAKNLAKRTGAKIGEFGEEIDEFSQYPTHDRWLNRYTDKYKDKPYRGQGQGYNFSDTGQATDVIYPEKISDTSFEQPSVGGTNLNDFQGVNFNTNITGGTNLNDFQGVNFNTNLDPNLDPDLYPTTGLGAAEGGRIGYADRGFVEDVNVEGPGFDENVMMASDESNDRILESLYEEHYDRLKGLGHDDKAIHEIIMGMFEEMSTQAPDQDQGLASLV